MEKEFYGSCYPNLPKNKKALSLLKKSKYIQGLELCELNKNIDIIKQSKLKVSIHNPLRALHLGLENEKFIQNMTEEKLIACKKTDTNLIGFHAGYQTIEDAHNPYITRRRTIKSIKFLKKNIPQKIIFESPPYINNHWGRKRRKIASPEYIKKLLKYSDGYLFDISHNFITMKNLEKQGINEYRRKILQTTKGKVLQIHLNCPVLKNNELWIDSHSWFTGRRYENEVLDFTKDVLKMNPQLKIITLEIKTNKPALEHAQILIQQVKYLREKLDIK